MKKYDSILKEKKKYNDFIEDNSYKKFPWFKIDVLLISVLLIISYLIYYNTILSPKVVFLNDIKILINKYESILSPIEINNLDNNYGIIGNIKLNDKDYDFQIDKIDKETKLILGLNEQNFHYYSNNNENYIKLNNNDIFYKLNNNDYFSMISNLKNYFNNIPKNKFIKKFYFNGTTPIVENNLILKNNDIIEALKPNHYNSTYEVLFTFKNNAITNEIISMKVAINNLMTNERGVLVYEKDYLTYRDDKLNLKLELEEKNKDFTLKIYKNDILFSNLSGTNQENSYQYIYQVIDKIYNINLNISKDDDMYTYDINSIIEKNNINDEQNMNITFQYADPFVDNNIDNSINYVSLSGDEKEIYKTNLDSIIGDLRKFVNKYKDSIN